MAANDIITTNQMERRIANMSEEGKLAFEQLLDATLNGNPLTATKQLADLTAADLTEIKAILQASRECVA